MGNGHKAGTAGLISRAVGMNRRRAAAALAFALLAATAGWHPRAEAARPARVVVSILPVHALAAGVMAGVGEPVLLIRAGASPHDASLRPADARALGAADLVIWVGPGLETFLEAPLRTLAGAARVITLTDALARNGAELLTAPPRGINPHLWLDPEIAGRIVRLTATALSELDPANAAAYRANAARMTDKLHGLDRDLRDRLAPVAELPYVVFHDAYAYFEARYALSAAGAFTVNPAIPPGARRLAGLRARIVEVGALCLFSEPQFNPAVVEALAAGTSARVRTLDPLGAGITPGPEAYFRLMRALAEGLAGCLEQDRIGSNRSDP